MTSLSQSWACDTSEGETLNPKRQRAVSSTPPRCVQKVRSQLSCQVPPPPSIPTRCGIGVWAAVTLSTSGAQVLPSQSTQKDLRTHQRTTTPLIIHAEITPAVTQVNQSATRTISVSQGFFSHPCGFKLSLKTGYERRKGKRSHPKILLQMIKHSQLKAS